MKDVFIRRGFDEHESLILSTYAVMWLQYIAKATDPAERKSRIKYIRNKAKRMGRLRPALEVFEETLSSDSDYAQCLRDQGE